VFRPTTLLATTVFLVRLNTPVTPALRVYIYNGPPQGLRIPHAKDSNLPQNDRCPRVHDLAK
jgi:hypothetical protein